MTHKEKCQALFKSVLAILKNATIIIPVIEGMVYTIWDLVKPTKKENKKDETESETVETTATEK